MARGTYKNEEDVTHQIDAWHKDKKTDLELHEYLGWSWEEFAAWIKDGTIPCLGEPESA